MKKYENIENNQIAYCLLLFLCMYFIVFKLKPQFIFTSKGTFREFGAGYANKTIIPMWLFTIVLAIISYLVIFLVINIPKLK
jgi:hypothetical protein